MSKASLCGVEWEGEEEEELGTEIEPLFFSIKKDLDK